MKPLSYRVEIEDAHAHLFRVTTTFEGPFDGDTLEAFLPGWTPGSYLQREFARNVVSAIALDAADRECPLVKIDKSTWRISTGRTDRVRLRMTVYANDLTVRTSHVDGTHAYFNGANLLPLTRESRTLPCTLTLDVPAGWRVSTTLPRNGEIFSATDYDHLADCPVEMGTHRTLAFEADGVAHEIAIWGEGNFDERALKEDLEKIVRAQAKLMGGFPFARYLFLIHLSDKGRGGLEHRDSTTLLYPRFGFRPKKEYEEFLRLASHEYFHAWNVKRIKPKAFDPYDYSRENYTSLLWAMEGFTEYYEVMALARAGLITRERMLAIWGEEITALLRTPGRKAQSLADSSFDSWIKYYRQDENSPNSGVSYYRKGALVALCLDLELRARTKNAKSLDDLMRLLLTRHGTAGHGVPEDGYAKAIAELGGSEMSALLTKYVATTDEIDFATHLSKAGLVFKTRPTESADDKGGSAGKKAKKPKKDAPEDDTPPPPWIGFDAKNDRGRSIVTHVFAGSPAAAAGVYAGDELLAFDGWRADDKAWRTRLTERAPGEKVTLTLMRRDRLVSIEVTLAPPAADAAWIEVAPDAQPSILESWSGTTSAG